jgi:hydroxymethylpyrimidine pyrophosphatase-like HAD family hydrolase
MKKKYFFFDIDATLTDDATHKIIPSAEWTLHELERNGHFVSIATGRAHYKTVSFTDPIGIRNLVCCGGACLVKDGVTLENIPLPIDTARQLIRHAEEDGLGYVLMLDDSDKVYMKDFRFLEQAGRRTELTTYILDSDLDPDTIPEIFKIYIAVPKGEEDRYPWISMHGHLRMGTYLNFQYDAKKDGIIRMMKLLDAPIEDVVVFGDAVNDLVMFDPAWTSIAMGNGMQELKDRADYVTAENTDDGIMKACLHFGWITRSYPG